MKAINTYKKSKRLLSLILICLCLTHCSKQPAPYYNSVSSNDSMEHLQFNDDFNKQLSSFWKPGDFGNGRYKAGTVIITENCHRPTVSSCAQLTLKQGNINSDGGDGHETERTELDSGKHPFLNSQVEYSYSFFIPKSFPVVDIRLVISQIKQKGLHNGPIFAQRFRNGIHYATVRDLNNDISKQIKFSLPDLVKGQWHDFKIVIEYSHVTKGSIQFFMNDQQYINFQGQTAYLAGKNRFYHKLGLYRDKMEHSMALLLDDYKLKQIPNKNLLAY